MYSRMDKYHGQKVQRFSIRKYSFGAASVAVAAYMMFGGAATVQAHEQGTSATVTSEQVNPNAGNQADSTKPVDSTETSASTVATPTTEQAAAPATATPAPEVAPAEPTKAVEAPVAKADTSKLEAAIARLEAALEKASSTEKTASAIESAKAELANAKAVVANEAATKEEVSKATSAVNGKAFVVESMPKATADKKEEKEKENKNQDPRNGQAIPGQGESGFRTVDTTAANSAEEATKYKGERDKALPELQANIDKVQAKLDAEKAKDANKKDQAIIDTYTKIIEKAKKVLADANAADATSAQKMSQQAEAVKSERDLLASYLAGKTELGAPVSENHVAYGNNPKNGVFESLKEGFGDKVTFTDADKKSETIATQYESGRDITDKVMNKPGAKDPIGSATYNWQEKAITKADAEAGMLNGWKIEKGDKVNAVKPLDVTNVTDKDGQPSTREVPKSKLYSNDGELKKYQTSGETSYVNGSGVVPSVTPTIDVMRTNAFGEVKNRDYYLELGSKGTTLSKEYDVNGNSRLNVNLIHSAAYGGSTATSAGERVKLTIVDAFTGKEIKPVEGKNGPLATEQGALAANGWNHLDRIYDIPAETTKIKVLIEAGSQGTNSLINDNNINIKDGYLIGGIGIATAPAAEVVTNVRSDGKTGEYGYTKDTIYDKGQKGNFDITIKNTGGMNIDYYSASNVEVTVEVPKGVVLEDKIYNANGGSNWLGNVWANTIKWVPNDPSDNSKGGKLTYNVPAGNRMAAAETNSRTTSIPFTAADNFVGPADFKVTVKSGFGDTDAEGNRLYSYTANGLKPAYENEFNRNGLADSDNPDYKYGKEIFINSLQTNSVITVPINTTDDQLRKIAYAKAQEAIKSPEFTKLLSDVKGTAALGDSTKSEIVDHDDDDLAITKVAEDGRGIVKVPVTYTVDGKTYETTVDIEVNVVESKTKPVVVFEGDEITPASVKEKVEPSEIDGKKGTANEPKATDIFKTDGKAGESGLKIPTTVTHNVDGTEVTEDVTVPVTVLPRTEGEVDVPKGATPDKVKETLKNKANELIKTPDFPAKVPEGYTVTVGEIPEIPADIANKKGEPVVVKVPVTFTSPDGTTYTSEIPVTVNVKGSEVKPVYVVEGNQPKPADVNEAITPDKGGDLTPVTEADINKDVPTDKVKVGATDLAVKATVKYPTGDETVDVPVKVLPKATPTGVTVLKDTDDTALTNVVKEKANEAVSKLTNLPAGITASLDEREISYTLPKTDSNGDKDTVPVKVLYKDDKGNVVGEDTINVPVKVVSSTPKPVVVFEGDTPKLDKDSVTPGEGGTVGEPTTVPSTKDKAGATDVTVDVPVTYDNGKVTETVKVPVTVLPKATADVTVVKNTTPDKLKELAKDKAKEAVEATDFKSKLPNGATVTVGDVTEDVLSKITAEKGTNTGTVNVPVTYTVDGKDYTTTIPVTVNVKGSDVKPVYVVEGDKPKAEDVNKAITPDTDGTTTPVTDEEINKAIPTTEGKVGSPDVKVTTKVTYKDGGDEEVTVPVTVLPKVKPEGVTVPKDADKTELAKVVKEKAEEAAKKLEGLPDGVTVTVTDVNTTPGTDTVGKQTPATVTVEYKDKDGNKITKVIEVPVNVVSSTPPSVVVFEGDTPNSEEIKKGITPGEGGTVGDPTKVPSTVGKAGDKDVEVEVPVTYGNGKFKENVKVPVTVLPKPKAGEVVVPKDLSEKELKDKVGKDAENAINNEEFKKKLPEGATVKVDLTNVTVPKTSEPGKAGEVEVPVIYTVNGKEYKTTVKVPVTVVEGKEQLVPKGDTPDPKDNITPGNYPEGATFEYDTPVDTSKPGKKEAVVIVKDKDGKEIVRVPVVVNVVEPKVTPIIVPERTKLTKEDVQKHIEIPGVTGWEIVGEPELPETFPAGVRPSATVTVKLPNGKTMKVQVPVIATPTVTPIVVPQGTTITPDDVKKHVNIPKESGWEIIEVGEIPTTETPGEKTAVKVKVKLPTGEIIELEVPVKVTPNNSLIPQTEPSPATPAPQTPQTPQPAGPTAPEQPVTPTEPGQPATPNQTQPAASAQAQADATVATDSATQPATPKYVEGQKELPNTGTEAHAGLAALGLLGALGGFGLLARKKKED
ncbi:YSIRK-type signal peptide-containing protein [Streptococcus bouchesdurhonensis]|uniref:YSIRK-type signal peptide-containing protein n=1 Tax=Streptococcus bouchesdurhonensis TaxID=2954240 RepID=UPI0021C29F6F|nr:YSIRK-type signal peptide-containing protein [Streptococcus bouchesdurhonensis]